MIDKEQLAALGAEMTGQQSPLCMANQIEQLQAKLHATMGLLKEFRNVVEGEWCFPGDLDERIDALLDGHFPEPVSLWVKCSERMPDFGSTVLVQFDTNVGTTQYTTADYVNLKVCAHSDRRVPTWFVTVSGGHRLRTVTHWMLLPGAPKP